MQGSPLAHSAEPGQPAGLAPEALLGAGLLAGLLALWVFYRIRKRWSRALRVAQHNATGYRTIFEQNLTAVAIHELVLDGEGRPADFRFTEVNPAFENITGRKRDDIIGRCMTDVLPGEESAALVRRCGEAVLSGHTIRFERHSPLLGRYYDLHVFPLGEKQFAVSFNDITDHKRAEQAVRAAEQQAAALLEGSTQGILTVDMDTRSVLFANAAMARLFGYRREEMMALQVMDLHPPESHEQVAADFTALLDRRKVVAEGIPCLRKDGSVFPADITAGSVMQGQRKVGICFFSDVTERIRADADRKRLFTQTENARRALLSMMEDEKRSHAERARLAMAVEQTAESIVITDPQGVIQYVNPAFTAVSGYTREEALGQNPRVLKSNQQDAEFYRKMWADISQGKVWTGRMINRNKGGSLYTEEVTISPVHNEQGEIINYVAVKRNITREIQVEQQLAQSQKMEVVGHLAGGVAHDFNNILQSIFGFIDLAANEQKIEVIRGEYLPEIQRAAASAASLTRQLLAFSRRQVLERKPVELNSLIEQMSKMVRRVIGEDITLRLSLSSKSTSSLVDPGQIEQVLMNLVVNARDAMPKGGVLTIATSVSERFPLEIPGEGRAGKYVQITVADNGVGMTEETKKHIFEPFFTTKPTGHGTGLGLATVFGIVKQHEGWITLDSELERGTEFHVFLPVTSELTEEGSESLGEKPMPRGHGERILVVEDEDSLRLVMERILTQNGYQVRVAPGVNEALAIFEENPDAIDLVFSDVVLQEGSGFDLVETLKTKKPHLRVLMASGYTDERTRWPQIREKGWRYLQKPLSLRLLLQTLQEMLRGVES